MFRRMRDQYIKSGDGFLLVYSITDRSSSTAITSFHEQIVAAKGKKDKIIPQIPIILVGNKVSKVTHCFLDCYYCYCCGFVLHWPIYMSVCWFLDLFSCGLCTSLNFCLYVRYLFRSICLRRLPFSNLHWFLWNRFRSH